MDSGSLQTQLDRLPDSPGVYLLKDGSGKVIYIGKAKSLKQRVRSYFQSGRPVDPKTEVLKRQIKDLDFVVTDSEVEALILESSLVKREKPKFNVLLKDDKSFLHIKITVNEPFPRVLLTRRVYPDGALYFGPYLPASLARNTIKIINRHFKLRTCDIEIDGRLERPCLEYQIHRCLGPCVAGLCTTAQYQAAVEEVVQLLGGHNEELIRNLTSRMIMAADEQNFEAAAFFRDRIRMVQDLAERQKMVLSGVDDVDVFAYFRRGPRIALQLFTLRRGKVVGKKEFFWEDLALFSPAEFLRDALLQYYAGIGFVPGEIFVPTELEDQELIEQWLTQKAQHPRGKKVRVTAPLRGEKHDLLLLVEQNAKLAFESRFRVLKRDKEQLLQSLQREFELTEPPGLIEAFDVSNIQGAETVASLVVCRNGHMDRSSYRKFKVRATEGSPNDFAAMREAVYRRYKRVKSGEGAFPSLILIDGGKGQLHSAYQALSELSIEEIPLAAIAKREELIFLQGQDEPIRLDATSPVLQLVQEIRDEAHRFAVSYHRSRRSMRDFTSELDAIPGIGEKRRKRLLRSFGSVARIRMATEQELAPFVGPKLARLVLQTLNSTAEKTQEEA